MDRRYSPRISVQLPVNVWGMDAFGQAFTSPAMITNMSTGGIVLRGIQRRMRIGDAVDVRMGASKAQFRVIWIAETAEMGLEAVTANTFLPASVLAHCASAAAAC